MGTRYYASNYAISELKAGIPIVIIQLRAMTQFGKLSTLLIILNCMSLQHTLQSVTSFVNCLTTPAQLIKCRILSYRTALRQCFNYPDIDEKTSKVPNAAETKAPETPTSRALEIDSTYITPEPRRSRTSSSSSTGSSNSSSTISSSNSSSTISISNRSDDALLLQEEQKMNTIDTCSDLQSNMQDLRTLQQGEYMYSTCTSELSIVAFLHLFNIHTDSMMGLFLHPFNTHREAV